MTIGWRFLCLLSLPLLSLAETRVFTEFSYDASGNIIGVQRYVTDAPPIVESLSPDLVSIGETFSLVATGTNLFGLEITSQDNSVQISNIVTSNTKIYFNVLADDTAPIGNYALTFSNPLGSSTGSFTIRERAPSLIVEPALLALKPGESQVLDVRFSSGDIFENTIDLSVRNSSVISVFPSSVTIPQGNTVPDQSIIVTAAGEGASSVILDVSNIRDTGIPVFVNEGFIPSPDGNEFYAASVSVFRDEVTATRLFVSDFVSVFRDAVISTGPFISDVVSVFREENSITGPFTSNLVSIFRDSMTANGLFVAGPVSVFRDESSQMTFSGGVSLLRDNIATNLSPTEVIADGAPIELLVRGVGLESVTTVSIVPADDITFGVLNLAEDSMTLNVPITVAPTAVIGNRQLVLNTANGQIRFVIADSVSGEVTEVDFSVLTIISN